ncbi:MAG: AI-2E family transporter [Phycisphaera sp.]|nr:AI-2E family transporter [Phycisphaera sp.]
MDAGKHLWEFKWVRDLAVLAVVVGLCYAAYTIRQVTGPIVLGAALAYAFNPLVTWAHRRGKVPRWCSATVILIVLVSLAIAFVVGFGAVIVSQATELLGKLPAYFNTLADRLGLDLDWKTLFDQAQAAAGSQLHNADASNARPVVEVARAAAGMALGLVTGILQFVSVATVGLVIVGFCFFFFVSHWGPITVWFEQFIPEHAKDKTLRIVHRMDKTVAGFIRGRLVQALVMAVVLSVGWKLAGVPYWLLLGVVTGLLNLIPFAGVIGFVLAVGLALVDHFTGGNAWSWGIVLWPTLVYAIAQGLDGWVVEPTVQGKATDLDALSVLLSVLIGGALAGLLGMLVAIPTAACIKILSQELFIPWLRNFAKAQNPTAG